MPRWSPVANTICYGRVERAVKNWMDMAPLNEWMPYRELVYHVCMELGSDSTHNLRSAISRACKNLCRILKYLERAPLGFDSLERVKPKCEWAGRTAWIRRLY